MAVGPPVNPVTAATTTQKKNNKYKELLEG
jgi:hypothetical protein